MIARFDGKCGTCGCVLKKGDEIFYDKAEGAHCWPCRDNPQPTEAQYALSQKLGFLSHDAAMRANWIERCTLPWTSTVAEMQGTNYELFGPTKRQ